MPREIKPLKWLVADLLARHVDELVTVCGPSLRHLPPDVRAALLAAARAADAWTTPRSPP